MPGLITLKCPTCGAKLRFEKGTQVFTCDHCGNVHLLESSGQALPARYPISKRDWISVGDYDILVHEVLEEQQGEQRLVYINIEYANRRSDKTLSCRCNQWLIFDQENYSYESAGSSKTLYEDRQRPYFGGERFLNPQMQARGWFAFKVPPGAQLKRLQFFTGFLAPRSVDILLQPGLAK